MYYRSTRGKADLVSFTEAVLNGLAPDGGLYIPEEIPKLSATDLDLISSKEFNEIAFIIFSSFISNEDIPSDDLKSLIERSFSSFRHPQVTPISLLPKFNDQIANSKMYLLELFHGPTLAFKDIALQFLGNVFEYILKKKNEKKGRNEKPTFITVIGATSGDTGSAAIYGLRGKENISVNILYPYNRVSPFQEAQMTSVTDDNVHAISVDGTFDDCQDVVKSCFNDIPFRNKHSLGAVNSINWCRILAQTVYYFYSYYQVKAECIKNGNPDVCIQFSVPTGNFGDVLAGYYAREMGLPIDKLIIATNKNDILHRFLETGSYKKEDNGKVWQTWSPAMDILVSSNFERLLWDLVYKATKSPQKASEQIEKWMEDLKTSGEFKVSNVILENATGIFYSASTNDDETLETIRKYFDPSNFRQVLDPHTAVGVNAAEKILRSGKSTIPTCVVCLATAHPAKFSEAVQKALYQHDKNLISQLIKMDDFEHLVSGEKKEQRIVIESHSTSKQELRIKKVKEFIEKINSI